MIAFAIAWKAEGGRGKDWRRDGSLFVAAHDLGTVRRYDASSGQYLGDFSVGTSPTYMTVDPNSVPEPSSGAMLLLGIGGLMALEWRRRNSTSR